MATDTEGSIPKQDTWKVYASEVNAGSVSGVPVGAIISWAKDLTGNRTIPGTFVECNGQVLSDSDSVYDGVTLPDLNGTSESDKLYLRGCTTSGGTGGSATADASHKHGSISATSSRNQPGSNTLVTGSISIGTTSITIDTIPTYVEMVWVIRVK